MTLNSRKIRREIQFAEKFKSPPIHTSLTRNAHDTLKMIKLHFNWSFIPKYHNCMLIEMKTYSQRSVSLIVTKLFSNQNDGKYFMIFQMVHFSSTKGFEIISNNSCKYAKNQQMAENIGFGEHTTYHTIPRHVIRFIWREEKKRVMLISLCANKKVCARCQV